MCSPMVKGPVTMQRHDDFPEAWRALAWYALRVTPGREFLAADMIASRRIPTATPRKIVFRRPSRYAKRREPLELPLLTGYVFAAVPLHLWRDVAGLNLVRGVVAANGSPARVPVREVANICARSSGGAFSAPEYQRHMHAGREFGAGDVVQIIGGPKALRGFMVEVTELQGEVAAVVMKMLGAERRLSINVDRLAAA